MIHVLELEVKISVDGNVNSKTIPDMVSAGADVLVLGSSSLFRKDIPISEAVSEVHAAIDLGIQGRKQ